MWLKIDESALDDWRIASLANALGQSYGDTLLTLLRVWRRLYHRGGGLLTVVEIDGVARRAGFTGFMVLAELAEDTPEGVRIRGDHHAEGVARYRAAQSLKATKRHQTNDTTDRVIGSEGDQTDAGAQPGLSPGNAGAMPLYTLSESGSGSLIPDPEARLIHPRRATAMRLWSLQDELRAEVDSTARPLKATESRLRRVEKALADNSEEDCAHVLRVYAADAKRTGSLEWFNGETNWRPDNFDRALGRTLTKAAPSDRAPDRAWLSNLGGTRRNA